MKTLKQILLYTQQKLLLCLNEKNRLKFLLFLFFTVISFDFLTSIIFTDFSSDLSILISWACVLSELVLFISILYNLIYRYFKSR